MAGVKPRRSRADASTSASLRRLMAAICTMTGRPGAGAASPSACSSGALMPM
jgi:hypothetical protein